MAASRVAKGTPLRMGGVSVLSYNLLAPLYVRPIDQRTGAIQAFAAFEWAEASALAWDTRQPALLKELEESGADLICLQEVQFEKGGDGNFALPDWLRLPGYEVRVPPPAKLHDIAARNLRVLSCEAAVGNALLWRADRLMEAAPRGAPAVLRKDGKKKKKKAGGNNGGSASPREQSVQRVGCLLRGVPGGELELMSPLAVFSVHLDATSEEKRVKQLSGCLECARALGTREVIIAGDMNTPMLRGSAVRAMTLGEERIEGCLEEEPTEQEVLAECIAALRLKSDGPASGDPADDEPSVIGEQDNDIGTFGSLPSEAQLAAWQELRESAARVRRDTRIHLTRVPTHGTRAAWDHGASCGPCVAWALDHILYTSSSLRLTHYWATLESDTECLEIGLPNQRCPSDHLPVGASFAPHSRPALDESGIAKLKSRVNELEERQSSVWTALQEQLEHEKAAAEAEAGIEPETASNPSAKRNRPPDAIVNFIRRRREVERQAKAELKAERQALAAKMGDDERDYADDVMFVDVGGSDGWCEQAGA
eukprot:scaffold102944_cov31-Tisochrysis_lutea.AAC.1